MAALERHGNGLNDTCPAVITLGGNTDADTFRAALAFDTSGRLPDGAVRPLVATTEELKEPGASAEPATEEGLGDGGPMKQKNKVSEPQIMACPPFIKKLSLADALDLRVANPSLCLLLNVEALSIRNLYETLSSIRRIQHRSNIPGKARGNLSHIYRISIGQITNIYRTLLEHLSNTQSSIYRISTYPSALENM